MNKLFLCCIFLLINVNLVFAEFNFDEEKFATDTLTIIDKIYVTATMTRREFSYHQVDTLIEFRTMMCEISLLMKKLDKKLETEESQKYNMFVPQEYPFNFDEIFNNITLDQGITNE